MSQHYMLRIWQGVRASIFTTVRLISDERLDDYPVETLPSVGELALRIISNEEGVLNLLQRQVEPWPSYTAKDLPTAEHILSRMEDVHLETMAYYNTLTHEQYVTPVDIPERDSQWVPRDMMFELIACDLHCRGQMYVVLQLLGYTPPSLSIDVLAP